MTAPSEHTGFRVLGIDPGLHVTGYGCVVLPAAGAEPELVEAGAIRPDGGASMAARLAQIHADVGALLAELRPDAVAVEKLYAHYKHPRTAILMAHARGAVLLAAEQAGVGVRDVAATNVKKALTGNGHASKRQVQLAVQAVWGLATPPEPPDVADALAIALCALRHGG